MPLACTVVTLLQDAKCLMCFSDLELLAAEVVLRERSAGGTRTSAELLADTVGWEQLSEHQRNAIEVAQLMDDVDETDVTALKDDLKCFCSISESQLAAMISSLKCEARQA
jgi:hypothetical protein